MAINGYPIDILVGGWPTPLQNIHQWEGWHPIYEMDNKTCLKPPTSHVLGSHKNHRSRVYKTHVEVTHRFHVDTIFRLG